MAVACSIIKDKTKTLNKRVQRTRHKVSGPLTRDVRINNNELLPAQWTFHTVNGKSIDNAVTI